MLNPITKIDFTKKYIVLFVLLTMGLMFSCKTQEEGYPVGNQMLGELPPIDVWLTITDSIGVELGDSNFVFGMPTIAYCLPNNHFAVMDFLKAKISVFDNSGDFITTVGKQGAGPGEFLQPAWFTVSPTGGLLVSDATARKLLFFDSTFTYIKTLSSFFPTPPNKFELVNDSTFIGSILDYEMTDQEINAGYAVAQWNLGSTDPTKYYFRELTPFDPTAPLDSEMKEVLFTISAEGTVYTSITSTEDFTIKAWGSEDSLSFLITEPYSRISKAQEILDSEVESMQDFLRHSGMQSSFLSTFEPDPFYNSISSLNIGPDDNLWIGLGFCNHPVFRVYDSNDGTFLYTAALENPNQNRNLMITMNQWGLMASDPMSSDWPRVYIVEVIDSSH